MNGNETLALRHVLESVDEAETQTFVAYHMLSGIQESAAYAATTDTRRSHIDEVHERVKEALDTLKVSVQRLKQLTLS